MKLIYIIGPYSAPTPWQVEQNVRWAEELAMSVARSGAMPVCPHTNTRFFHGTLDEEFWYAGTMEMLRRCDAVIEVTLHRRSKGVLAELAFADECDLPIFSNTSELRQWLRKEGEIE